MAHTLRSDAAKVGEDVALPYGNIGREVYALDAGAIRKPIARARAGGAITKHASSATGKARQAVLSKDAVVNADALLDALIAEQVVKAVDAAGIALYANLATLNVNSDGGRETTFMLKAGLAFTDLFASDGIYSNREHVTNDRQVVLVFLRNR